MTPRVLSIITTVILAATVLLTLAVVHVPGEALAQIAFWTLVCIASELFWVRTLSGDSVQSLASTTKLATILLLGIWPSLVAIWASTLVGNFFFRRTAWYKGLYNASQITIAGAFASVAFTAVGGRAPGATALSSPFHGQPSVTEMLAQPTFIVGFLAAGIVYFLVNNTLMAGLMSLMTGRRLVTLWRENCLYIEEIQSNTGLVLMIPLLTLLYGFLGILGLGILFASLGLIRIANSRYVALINAQESAVRGERMAAMGDMAEEIGVALGDYLAELKERTLSLMGRARSSQEAKILKSADVIDVNVGQMSALIEGLAAFSRQETRKQPTDLNALVSKTVEFVQPQNRFDEITFETRLHPSLPTLQIDPGQIQQVLINLLANAADAMNEHGTESKRIVIETELAPGGGAAILAVTDTGPGIPKQSLARVFEPHFTTKPTGHGFGLSTAFRIASNHHGSIKAHNETDMGACFLLQLPA